MLVVLILILLPFQIIVFPLWHFANGGQQGHTVVYCTGGHSCCFCCCTVQLPVKATVLAQWRRIDFQETCCWPSVKRWRLLIDYVPLDWCILTLHTHRSQIYILGSTGGISSANIGVGAANIGTDRGCVNGKATAWLKPVIVALSENKLSKENKLYKYTAVTYLEKKAEPTPLVLLWVNVHFDSVMRLKLMMSHPVERRLASDCCIINLIDVDLPDASNCLMPPPSLSLSPLCPGIDYKTTTILLDGRRVKLELWWAHAPLLSLLNELPVMSVQKVRMTGCSFPSAPGHKSLGADRPPIRTSGGVKLWRGFGFIQHQSF